MAKPNFPQSKDTIQPIHKVSSLPLRLLSALNLGPLGGDNSISVIIETVLAKKRGEKAEYPLSKTEQFFVKQLTKNDIPPEMVEYRSLSLEAQKVLLKRHGDERLGVIWIGAGVYSMGHPLLKYKPEQNWHIWTDRSPRVVHSALQAFSKMQAKGQIANLSHTILLPQDGKRLNEWIQFLSDHVDRIVIMGYGVTYALTLEENKKWMKQIDMTATKLPVHFVFNSPGEKIPFLPGLMAAYHKQRMVYYANEDVASLFSECFAKSNISWHKTREETESKIWATWIVDVLPQSA